MKSTTWPTPDSVKNRVTSTAVSGKYTCVLVYSMPVGCTRKWPPFVSSSRAPKTLGESNRGKQNQSIDPSVVTRAAVCRSPIIPWSAMAVSRLGVCVIPGDPGAIGGGGPPLPRGEGRRGGGGGGGGGGGPPPRGG